MESSVITTSEPADPPRPVRAAPLAERPAGRTDGRRYAPTCINHRPPIIGRLTLGRPSPIYCRVILSTPARRPRSLGRQPSVRPVGRSIQQKTSAIKAAKRPTIIETDGRMDRRREGREDEMKERMERRIGRHCGLIGVVKCHASRTTSAASE